MKNLKKKNLKKRRRKKKRKRMWKKRKSLRWMRESLKFQEKKKNRQAKSIGGERNHRRRSGSGKGVPIDGGKKGMGFQLSKTVVAIAESLLGVDGKELF